ncbi:YqaE/Pmp3 family membrane protein [Avibacterium sp. 21-586]|uniref:YqaE/Pmp3 family membrane protein n=1 Tax=Avibacterium sp. 21-586 TaxID=2911534 RepID=UPI00224778DC|nr:YqaE/Pmp3 family membrane protein [Avibacterium sp. 21-586]MCW9709921.1 YqaE/Pmp3 family membrane protein [Avibacterium sp. 21-586]
MIRIIIALLLPWLTFFTIGRPFSGIICLILQITLFGWLPAAVWAVYALTKYNESKLL